MNTAQTDFDISALIWPEPFKFNALLRTRSQQANNPDLWQYYQTAFAIFGSAEAPPVPFAKQVPDLGADERLAPPQPDVPLSIVVVSRNDDHVERMQERTQAFIDGIIYLTEKKKVNVEILIVEWNPPADRPSFVDQFEFPQHSNFLSIKVITVPEGLHQCFRWSDKLPLYQMIGKNAAIRRAVGEYILVTNIDILLSEELFDFVTSSKLQSGLHYRSNRWDVDIDILNLQGAETKVKAARDLCLRVNYRDGADKHRTIEQPTQKTECFDPDNAWYPNLHTEGCGDFQMLHRDDWYRLRGYPEIDCFSFHIDSLFSYTCHYAGIPELALDDRYPHFHIDHTIGAVTQSDTYTVKGVGSYRHISCESIIALCNKMYHERDYLVFNAAHWGMANEMLPVAYVTKADWCPSSHKYEIAPGKGHAALAPLDDFPLLGADYLDEAELWLKRCISEMVSYINTHAVGRPLYIWGYGARGRVCALLLQEHSGDRPQAFIQSTPVSSTAATEPQVLSPDALIFDGPAKPFVIVASMHADCILPLLNEMGAHEGKDYILWC